VSGLSDLSIVLRSLRTRAFSTATTALTVGVAVALLLTLLSLRAAGQRAFDRGSGNAHLLVSADASPIASVLNALFYANAPQRALEWSRYEAIRASFPWAWGVPIQQGDSYRGYPVLATVPEFFTRFEPSPGDPWSFAKGRAFTRTPTGEGTGFEVVLGSTVAATTGLKEGARLLFTHGAGAGAEHGHVHEEHEFTVVGILGPTGSAHDRAIFTDLESSWILHAQDRLELEPEHEIATAASLVEDDRKITGILLRVPTREGSNSSASIQSQFDRLRRDPTLTVAMPSEQVRQLFAIVANVDSLFLAIAAAVLLASAVSILLALYHSMGERRRQIALFRTLGCSGGRLVSMVLAESASLGFLGGLVGIAMALVGGSLAAGILEARVGLVIEPGIDPRAAVITLGATVALAVLAGIVPAVRAYRTPILENLRPAG
jgi:putative ABC transport system permease protein